MDAWRYPFYVMVFLPEEEKPKKMSYSSGSNSRNEPMCLKQILWYKREETNKIRKRKTAE